MRLGRLPQSRDRGDEGRLRRRLRLAAAQCAAQHRLGRDLGLAPPWRRRRHGLFAACRHGDRRRRHRRGGAAAGAGAVERPRHRRHAPCRRRLRDRDRLRARAGARPADGEPRRSSIPASVTLAELRARLGRARQVDARRRLRRCGRDRRGRGERRSTHPRQRARRSTASIPASACSPRPASRTTGSPSCRPT